MKKKNYITPNLIIVSIATDSLVLAGSGGDPQLIIHDYIGNRDQLGKYGSFADDDDNDMEWDW